MLLWENGQKRLREEHREAMVAQYVASFDAGYRVAVLKAGQKLPPAPDYVSGTVAMPQPAKPGRPRRYASSPDDPIYLGPEDLEAHFRSMQRQYPQNVTAA